MKKTCVSLFTGLALLSSGSPAWASSIPAADLERPSISIGSSPSFSLNVPFQKDNFFGGSIALPLLFGDVGYARYDIHLGHQFISSNYLSVAAVMGVFGDLDLFQRNNLSFSPVGIELGLALTYHIDENMMVRGNIVPGIGFPASTGRGIFSPLAGIEFVYRLDEFEGTLGFNGNGDIFSLNYYF